MNSYAKAQHAMAMLKEAIHSYLQSKGSSGSTNAEIGRSLGIYKGHIGHDGHIPRTLLAIMESKEVVVQDAKTKKWSLRSPL